MRRIAVLLMLLIGVAGCSDEDATPVPIDGTPLSEVLLPNCNEVLGVSVDGESVIPEGIDLCRVWLTATRTASGTLSPSEVRVATWTTTAGKFNELVAGTPLAGFFRIIQPGQQMTSPFEMASTAEVVITVAVSQAPRFRPISVEGNVESDAEPTRFAFIGREKTRRVSHEEVLGEDLGVAILHSAGFAITW